MKNALRLSVPVLFSVLAFGASAPLALAIVVLPSTVYVDSAFTDDASCVAVAGPDTLMGTDCFTTVQDGITGVADGGTVNVTAGTYDESLIVDKTLSIIGVGETTVIQPAIDENGITITADNVSIQNLKVNTSNSAPDSTDPDYNAALPNIAVRLEGTSGVSIVNSTIETSGNKAMGIWVGGSSNSLDPSSNLTIIGTTVTIAGEATGIYAAHSSPAHSDG